LNELLLNGLQSINSDVVQKFAERTAQLSSEKLKRERRDFTLRFSNIGTPCVRRLWLEARYPDDLISSTPDLLFKFNIGDLTEEYLLFLVELAGHDIQLRQHEVTKAGIKGHIDCIIDGMLVDVKSASSYSFRKFQNGLTEEEDTFGYLVQLASYLEEVAKLPEVTYKNEAAFLVFDKSAGNIHLDRHVFNQTNLTEFFEERKEILKSDKIPDRFYQIKPDGYKNKDKEFVPNGNEYLGKECEWCPLKFKCYDNIRVFKTWDGLRYYTKIVKEPQKLEEVTDFQKK
jgi:hypothetical protein